MNQVVVAALLLAVALAVPGGPPGRARLRELQRRRVSGVAASGVAASGVAGSGVAASGVAGSGADPVVRWPVAALAAVATGAAGWAVAGVLGALLAGGAVAGVCVLLARRRGPLHTAAEPPAAVAAAWEVVAVCLEAGLPVATAVAAGAEQLLGPAGARLRRIGGLLELGASPAEAWSVAAELPALAAFARAAARSAASGAALAQVARVECTRLRAEQVDAAQAGAQRAGVLITGPLGACFLPAFLVLGIAPVVIGLAGQAFARW